MTVKLKSTYVARRKWKGAEQSKQWGSWRKRHVWRLKERKRKTIMEAHLAILKPVWATQQNSVKKEEKGKGRGEGGKTGKGRRERAGRLAEEMVHQ